MMPVASVVWVDLKKQQVGGTVEIPGCALVFPWGEQGFSSLCGDGSLASVLIPASGPPTISHTKPFFDAANDPIFDNSFVDRATGKAIFLSYTGLVYQAKLGADTTVSRALVDPKGRRLCAGRHRRAGVGMAPRRMINWRPIHKASGKLFVLMHPGNYWTHKHGGTEVWVLDTKTHALVSRFPLRPVPSSGLGR